MSVPTTLTKYCLCCGHDKPRSDFRPYSDACVLCEMLAVNEAIKLARETLRREYSVSNFTKAGRKAQRIEKRMAIYEREGKKCTACWEHKPVSDYNKCAPQSDGLQPLCRTCHKIWVATTKHGGKPAWERVRESLRAEALRMAAARAAEGK